MYPERYLLHDIQPIGNELKMIDITFDQSYRRPGLHRHQSANRKLAARGRGKSSKGMRLSKLS